MLLQIIHDDGRVLQLKAGGPLEADLVAACTAAIVAKGVGILRTEAQVKRAIAAGIREAIQALKSETVRAD